MRHLGPENGETRIVEHIVGMMCRFRIIGSKEFQQNLQKVEEGDADLLAKILPTPQPMSPLVGTESEE